MNSPEDSKRKADGGQPSPEQPNQPPSDAKSSAKPGLHLGLIAGAVAVLLVIGFFVGIIPHWRQAKATKSYTQELAVTTVAVVSPAPGKSAAGLMLPAEVRPWLDASIFAQVSGYLKTWLVDIGAQVKEGQLLAIINTPEVDQQLEQARAQLVLAQANLKLARITDERWQALVKKAAVSEQEAAQTSAAWAVAAANVDATAANVRRLEALKSFQRVIAPSDGTITLRNVDIGDLIVAGAGGKELFHLAQTGKLRVYVRVPEPNAPDVSPGQSAELVVSQAPGKVFPAKVITTSRAVSPVSRTLQVELEADNSEGLILPGSYGQVRLTGAKPSPRLVLPSNTILFRAQGLQVGVVGTNNTVELRQVQIGRDFGQTVEIASGVTLEDRVIINPSGSLVSGTVVRVTQAPPTPAAK
ncbi:efflux RND transporter periplasmic adaptor subunit [Pedosphaera parvula]|uniref:Efflux transporter, RND family, MFP subunit n=1 Tax=Pedosphaera parvula (strain Ellin514) TaxID=320771 RepID=B9XML7_PEDPL|nr:efflux RND transporter periplasmic adaptor subunit [Pedosphaera parvula]EEF58916.1 efflux transporter, RND family, MFP subunit [Pedosphaera parvula Ellin514]